MHACCSCFSQSYRPLPSKEEKGCRDHSTQGLIADASLALADDDSGTGEREKVDRVEEPLRALADDDKKRGEREGKRRRQPEPSRLIIFDQY
ncbi:hypothetical protein BHM03_00012867 [Ensete ventricosum]|uniref:Uncharacterized protein n=1 Tax=Ensete ventricosum TaxID=4639 RepID=A0A445MDK4_ENSVE|nr:hypothetical protein BHM03_00012867 [Ensete ventricosum]